MKALVRTFHENLWEALNGRLEVHAAFLEAANESLYMIKSDYLQMAVEFQAKKRQVEIECSARAALEKEERIRQVDSLKMALNALKSQNSILAKRCASLQVSAPQSASGFDWQFSNAPDEWTSLPSDTSEQLQGCYEAYLNGGEAVVQMKSGVEKYKFDLRQMCQTNIKTGKRRALRCQLDTPSNWDRCVDVDQACGLKRPLTIRISHSRKRERDFDGVFQESAHDSINGRSVWWRSDGRYFIYKAKDSNKRVLLAVTDQYKTHDYSCSRLPKRALATYDGAVEWNGTWWEHPGLRAQGVSITEQVQEQQSFMDVAVEMKEFGQLSRIFLESSVHCTALPGWGACDDFKQCFDIIRVFRIENWSLWRKYSDVTRLMKRDLAMHKIQVPVETAVSNPLQSLQQLHQLDAAVNERYLFHGTTFEKALLIVQQGFDVRLSNPGYYGQGTYFASQACKAHQYASPTNVDKLRTMLLCRVAVGDACSAQKVQRELRRPETHGGTLRCYDSVVANPGPMPGHHMGQQTHQEVVIFGQFQAYPEYVIQYAV